VYARSDELFSTIMCDSRETIPLTLGLFRLAEGDVARCVTYATNLGRDADTTATMAGAIAGALGGARAIREDWRAKAMRLTRTDQPALAEALARTALRKREQERAILATLDTLIVPSDHTSKESKA
jgi:ADP-ribosylglycohydrolase